MFSIILLKVFDRIGYLLNFDIGLGTDMSARIKRYCYGPGNITVLNLLGTGFIIIISCKITIGFH